MNAKGKLGWTPLHQAADHGHREIVGLLLAKGADVNAKGLDRWTPLNIATASGHKEVAELLISKGVDLNPINDFHQTPGLDVMVVVYVVIFKLTGNLISFPSTLTLKETPTVPLLGSYPSKLL